VSFVPDQGRGRDLRVELDAILEIVARGKGLDLPRLPAIDGSLGAWHRAMEALALRDAASYRTRVENDSSELDELAAASLVHVTSFFRDASVFRALETHVLPAELANRFRGPSAGLGDRSRDREEAYSLAIVLSRACESRGMAYRGPGYRTVTCPRSRLRRVTVLYARTIRREKLRAKGAPSTILSRGGGPLFASSRPSRSTCTSPSMTSCGPRLAPKGSDPGRVRPRHMTERAASYLDECRSRRERSSGLPRSSGARALVLGQRRSAPQSSRRSFQDFPGPRPRTQDLSRVPA